LARRSREEAEQTRQLLLETALRHYAIYGIHQTSLKAIAADAGVTHGALYWHFKNRDDLIVALASTYTLPFERAYMEHLQAIDQDALSALAGFLTDTAKVVLRETKASFTFSVFYQRRAELPEIPALNEMLQSERMLWLDYIDRFLKQARKQKQIRKKTKSQPMAEVLLSQMFGLLILCLWSEDESTPVSTLIATGIENAIRGLDATKD